MGAASHCVGGPRAASHPPRMPVVWIDLPVLIAKMCSFMIFDTMAGCMARPAIVSLFWESTSPRTCERPATIWRAGHPVAAERWLRVQE